MKEKLRIYKKEKQIIYKSDSSKQAIAKKRGLQSAATLLGTASIFLSNAPLSAYAAEISEIEGTSTTSTNTSSSATESKNDNGESDFSDGEIIEVPNDGGSSESEKPEVETPADGDNSKENDDINDSQVDPGQNETPKVETPKPTPTNPETPATPEQPTTPSKPVEAKPEEPRINNEREIEDTNSENTNASIQEESVPSQPAEVAQTDSVGTESPVTSIVTNSVVPDSSIATDGSIHFEANESVETFIRKIGESARKIGQEEDLYASVMIAQAILESGAGSSELSSAPNYNLFGIKGSYEGQSVTFDTQEDQGGGSMITIQDGFRRYKNYEESFEDYAKLLKEGIFGDENYYSGTWKSNANNYEDATKFLTGRYATDTQYNKKLNGLIETYELEKYDKELDTAKLSATGFAMPVKNYTISSQFGARGGEFHRGLDMAASQGEPIYASKAGIILKAEFHYSWGNYVVIEHDNGMSTLYAHQAEYVVQSGDQVEQGQLIGYVGSTGNSTGSHLHFEVCQDSSLSTDQLVNPEDILFR